MLNQGLLHATAVHTGEGIFPLPMIPCEKSQADHATMPPKDKWLFSIIASLNWMNGFGLSVPLNKTVTPLQRELLEVLRESMVLFDRFEAERFSSMPIKGFWQSKMVNAYGEECHSAVKLKWANLVHSLPSKDMAGVVPGEECCVGGVRDFLINPEKFVKPTQHWVYQKPPRVYVDDCDWRELAAGLLRRGICEVFPLDEAIHVQGQPVLGGLFGVPKNETVDGVDVLRLIMDLRPVNHLFESIVGDMNTLPMLSQLLPLEIHPSEGLLVSSEDIKAMFYIVGLNQKWRKFLCFGKPLPPDLCPDNSRQYVLSSRVLPMGFINSVAVAQHLHRQIVNKAVEHVGASRETEIRRDQPLPQTSLAYRIYLDNFDCLKRTNPEAASILEGSLDELAEALRGEYRLRGIPRNEKKSVQSQSVAEIQGAVLDGAEGLLYPKLDKTGRYLRAGFYLLRCRQTDLKRLQITLGGFNYLFSFRRPLMSIFNHTWRFASSFEGNVRIWQVIPSLVKEELFSALALSMLAYMDLRLPYDDVVSVSDASETGGGLCQSVGLTRLGVETLKKPIRGEAETVSDDRQILVVSVLGGIASLRLALDTVEAKVAGYVAFERDPSARQVAVSNFPSIEHLEHVEDFTDQFASSLAARYPRVTLVLIAGRVPCKNQQGFRNDYNLLLTHFPRIREIVKTRFTWCEVLTFVESMANLDDLFRQDITRALQLLPYKMDAVGLSMCRRPSFCWFDWQVSSEEGVDIRLPPSSESSAWGRIVFDFPLSTEGYLPPGWSLAGGSEHKLPNFVRSEPKTQPPAMPAGIESCSQRDVTLWATDRWRFPLFQYAYEHGIVHKRKGWKLPGVLERESILGYPLDYTLKCLPKNIRKSKPQLLEDTRLCLLASAMSVQLASFLTKSLCEPRGLCFPCPVSALVQRCRPGSGSEQVGLDTFLSRPPWKPGRSGIVAPNNSDIIRRLASLVSSKGSDILLKASTEAVINHDRFRTTIPPHLWVWKSVCGWKWKYGQESEDFPEHINRLELRACLTSIRWRIEKQRIRKIRFLHLVDSLVSLHILNKGRSSSRKLQQILKKISSLLLLSRSVCLLGYVDTAVNPADAPSRRGQHKRKWENAQL